MGASALLARVAGPDQAWSLARAVRAAGVPVTDVVPAATTVLLDGVADAEAAAAVRRAVAAWRPDAPAPPGPLVELPVVYDGADLDDVARRWGTDRDGVVARHSGTEMVAAFCGFAPGFAYLTGLPDELGVPRLDRPRSRVPAGSVALAGTWCGVYPTASPGGWRLLGRTDVVLWDEHRPEPALLPPGTRVRFVPR